MSTKQRQHLAEITRQMDLIEAEMKRAGLWNPNPPDLLTRYASGELSTYLDAPSFELWLQQVFLPNARQAAAEDALPKGSQVGVMAMRQWEYHSSYPEAQALLSLLNDFDDMVERYGKSA